MSLDNSGKNDVNPINSSSPDRVTIKTDHGSGGHGGVQGHHEVPGQGQGIVDVVCQTSAWMISIKG